MKVVIFLLLALASIANAQSDAAATTPDPAMAPITDDPKLPRVLIIGDSISIGYTLPVRKLLAGEANVHRIPVNGGPTTRGLEQLAAWLGTGRWDVIHFNFGLHDLKVSDSGEYAVPVAQYETNLTALVEKLQATGATLIWASTTPVPAGKLSPIRRAGDEVIFNAPARRVMDYHGIAINDLHAAALALPAKSQRPANVHFTPAASAALAKPVAEAIRAAMKRHPRDRAIEPAR